VTGETSSFVEMARQALADGTFVRITLGKYRGPGDVQKAVIALVTLKEARHLRVVTSQSRKDVTEIFPVDEGLQKIAGLAGSAFLSATLFTTAKDVTLIFNKKKKAKLSEGKPTFKVAPPSTAHNRVKQYAVDPASSYLKGLGISQADGTVKPSMYPKFKQICHFVDIADDLLRESDLSDRKKISVVDIGSGKGYLTFALYDHLTARLGKDARVIGIEVRPDLVTFCSALAKTSGFNGLSFAASAAGAHKNQADMVMALHACDTATDDALAQGILGQSALIICAPCCQHELAPQIGMTDEALAGLMKFGLFKQRQADLVTDAARALLLEASGYKVKVIEFVSTEHTAKNILIAAVRSATVDRAAARQQYAALKALMGFETQHLETRLIQSVDSFLFGEGPVRNAG
jgi:SAM-dependent methyltransferase